MTLLLLSPLVIAPLVLRIAEPDLRSPLGDRWFVRATLCQGPAAILLVPACQVSAPLLSGLLALPWLAFSAGLAIGGVKLWLQSRSWADRAIAAGFLFLPVGASWLIAWRIGWRPLGFEDVIVMLTAIHFHYAGFVLPLLAGWAGRALPGRLSEFLCAGVIVGVPAVALGITSSQVGGPFLIEALCAVALSAAGIGVALQLLRRAVRTGGQMPLVTGLWVLAGLTLTGTMLLSILYGLRLFLHWEWLNIPWMRAWHGTGNALGACLCGMAAEARRDMIQRRKSPPASDPPLQVTGRKGAPADAASSVATRPPTGTAITG